MQLTTRNYLALAVTIFGCTAMVGDLLNIVPLKGVGLAAACAPMPKVFCDNNGLEGFASEFDVLLTGTNGAVETIPLTPKMYSRMRGPYNRRNVYGAALSYGPKLPPAMWQSVLQHGLGPSGTLRSEFGLPMDARSIAIRIRTKTAGRSDSWTLRSATGTDGATTGSTDPLEASR